MALDPKGGGDIVSGKATKCRRPSTTTLPLDAVQLFEKAHARDELPRAAEWHNTCPSPFTWTESLRARSEVPAEKATDDTL
jgi:hypothetical protein